ncbi:hypothetical protein M9H77_20471 [Catharanthus roseus]|uniref:Uncharacterized protein n=1 Tax=Catharanthus roseus TaxID=4058 RepID=A0ACC0ANZ2_CATRO|nr:hypothetical protein M9H77_20471 [Catharanthus roseus]
MGRGHKRKYVDDVGLSMEPMGTSAPSTHTQPAAPVPLVPTSQITTLLISPPTTQPTVTLSPSMAPTISTLTAQLTPPSVALEMAPLTWKLLLHDTREVLELNIDLGFISFTMSLIKKQAVLAERFSRSKELEELHKDRKGEKKGERKKFYKIKKKAKEEAATMSTTVPDDLRLMAIEVGGMTCNHLYGAIGPPSYRGLALIGPCYADGEQRMLRRWRLLFLAVFLLHRCRTSSELLCFPFPRHLHRLHMLLTRRSLPLKCRFDPSLPPPLMMFLIDWYNCSIELVCCLQLQSFDVKLIDVNKTCKVTKGGPVMKYAAMLAYGNYHGVVGYAKAKGPAIPIALQKVGILFGSKGMLVFVSE